MTTPPPPAFRWPVVRICLVLAVGIAISSLLWLREQKAVRHEGEVELERAAARISEDLGVRFGRIEQSLLGLRGLFAVNGNLGRKTWETYLDSMEPQPLRGLFAFAYLRRVPRSEEASFITEMRSEFGPEFHIVKNGAPEEMAVIVYRRAYRPEPEFSGVDRSKEPGWITNGDFTRRSGRTALTRPVPAIGSDGMRLVVIMPLYKSGSPVATEGERMSAHYGWITAGLRPMDFFSDLAAASNSKYQVEVLDIDPAGYQTTIYQQAGEKNSAKEATPYTLTLPVFNHTWQLRLTPLPGIYDQSRILLANQLFAGGLFTTGLLCLLIWNAGRTEQRALAMAAKMTGDLQEREWALREAQRIAQMGSWTRDLKTGRLTHSEGYLRIAGVSSPDDLPMGDFLVSLVHPEEKSRAIAYIEKMNRGETLPPQIFRILRKDGAERIAYVDQTMLKADGRVIQTMGVVQDITERAAADRALAESHTQLGRLMKIMPGAVFQLHRSADGTITLPFVSEGALSLFGLPAADLMADPRRLLGLMESMQAQQFNESLADSSRTFEPWHYETLVHLPFGGRRWARYSAIPERGPAPDATTWHGVAIDVTAAKQVEQALRESEQRLRFTQFAVDHVRDAVAFVSPEGDRIYVNDETCQLTGYTREELLRNKIWTSFDDFTEEAYGQLWLLIKRKGTHTFETALRTKDGKTCPVEVGATFINFGGREIVFAIARDISSRKAAEGALRASEEQLRFTQFALDHAQDTVAIIDRDGNRLHVNETFCHFTGRTRDELLNTKVWQGIPSLNPDRYRSLWEDIKRCGTLTFEIELLASGGEKKPVEVNASFLNFGGKEAICTVARDLSTRKAAELEKKRMEQQLQETQKLESLGVLAGGIAHDFNNLLTGILGNASLARDRLPEDADLHEPLRQIERASVRAAELCQQMLAYAGKGQFVVESVDLSSLVEDTAKLLELTVAKRSRLELRLAKSLSPVLADATQIRQIVMNLVLNAAEAIGHGDGLILVSTGRMQVDAAFLASARVAGDLPVGEGIFLEIQDNGAGMDHATLERIFEPFFTTKFTGRGLGLAAVLGIVRSHRGALDVRSVPGKGTTFRLVLAPHSKQAGTVSALTPRSVTKRRNSGRVLVVDDEESVRSVTKQALERTGFVVETAEDGEAALHVIGKNPTAFVVILLDYTMPRLDGAQTLREIRRINPQACVILMSGFSEHEARERLGDDALAGFVQKPFDLATLRSRVEDAVKKS